MLGIQLRLNSRLECCSKIVMEPYYITVVIIKCTYDVFYGLCDKNKDQ